MNAQESYLTAVEFAKMSSSVLKEAEKIAKAAQAALEIASFNFAIESCPQGFEVRQGKSCYYGSHEDRGYCDLKIVFAVPVGTDATNVKFGHGTWNSDWKEKIVSFNGWFWDDGAWVHASKMEDES